MKVNFNDIYKHIGFLFYGLATANGKLSTAGFVKLTDVIESIWKPFNGDPVLNLHLVDCIHDGISYAAENSMSSEHALVSFKDYYKIHALPFSQALKERIVASAISISTIFSHNSQDVMIKEILEELMELKRVKV